MRILIAGGTGFIGSALCKYFVERGDEVTVLTRGASASKPHGVSAISDISTLGQTSYDVVINLAGEALQKHRWNDSFKQSVCNSRINTTRAMVEALSLSAHKPKVFLSGSAIGFYGNSLEASFTEQSSPAVVDFPHTLCAAWEAAAHPLNAFGVRVCALRTGIVLGRHSETGRLGGALASMISPFRYGLGAQLGNGQQWMSWIHLDDMVGIIDFLIQNPAINGPVNLTAPHPVTNAEFTRTLAQCLHRPCFLSIPAVLVRALFGAMGNDLLLYGQKVLPEKMSAKGDHFKFSDLAPALLAIL